MHPGLPHSAAAACRLLRPGRWWRQRPRQTPWPGVRRFLCIGDIERCELVGKGFREAFDREFAAVIEASEGQRDEAAERGNIDDDAAALPKVGEHGLRVHSRRC